MRNNVTKFSKVTNNLKQVIIYKKVESTKIATLLREIISERELNRIHKITLMI